MQAIHKTTELVIDDQLGSLSNSVLFQGVPEDLVDYFVRRCSYATFEPKEVLLRPDQANETMFLILSGRVSVYISSLETEPLVSIGPGECVGEMSLFDGKSPSAYVVTESAVSCLVIDARLLWRMINVSHGVSRNLLHLLAKRIRGGNAAVTDSKQLQQAHEQAANTDALTGLHNRRWLEEILIRTKGKTLEDLAPVSAVMLDVDHFKRFNDEHGHQAGDVVLRIVAKAMQTSLRPNDMVARYGGEEFIVLLPYTDHTDAVRVAERLRESVANSELGIEGETFPSVTISLGISEWTTGQPLEHLIAEADAALYRAKRKGRNCVSL